MQAEDLLREYHKRIGEIFLAAGQTPYRISKQVWALHAEMERQLAVSVFVQPEDDTRAVEALRETNRYNRIRNDLDMYLAMLAKWGLGEIEERPKPSDYGVAD